MVSRFVYGTRPNVPDYMTRGGRTNRLVTDHLGSVRLVVNAGTGEVAQRIDYDAFGRVTLDTSPGFQPFGFAGGMTDTHTALVRFGARDYDPSQGRWTSKDPIGLAGQSANLYGYVRNDPVNLVDPSGLLFWDALDVGFFLWSLSDFINCPGWGTGAGLAMDAAGLLPIIPAVGALRRLDDAGRVSSDYIDITRKGSVPNRATDVPRGEFEDNLLQNGWDRSVSKDGKVTIFEKDGARYTVRDTSRSTGGPSVEYFKPGSSSADLKIRLPR